MNTAFGVRTMNEGLEHAEGQSSDAYTLSIQYYIRTRHARLKRIEGDSSATLTTGCERDDPGPIQARGTKMGTKGQGRTARAVQVRTREQAKQAYVGILVPREGRGEGRGGWSCDSPYVRIPAGSYEPLTDGIRRSSAQRLAEGGGECGLESSSIAGRRRYVRPRGEQQQQRKTISTRLRICKTGIKRGTFLNCWIVMRDECENGNVKNGTRDCMDLRRRNVSLDVLRDGKEMTRRDVSRAMLVAF
ncbi:hypothetical protein FKP32DRAFT_109586 [Trametes sanguinea]|nr:hypothetical protein FKP32DRAFT_109586 [Trametes sanguinea]